MGCGSSRRDVVEHQTPRLFSKVRNDVRSSTGITDGTNTSPPILSANSVESERTTISRSSQSSGPLPPVTGSSTTSGAAAVSNKDRLNSSVAFHIPITSQESEIIDGATGLVQKYPPRRFQRLEDCQQQQQPNMQSYRDKLAMVEQRRQQIISNRVQSARSRNLRSAGRLRSLDPQSNPFGNIESGIGDIKREFDTVIF